jgi:hypothetical protein
MSQLAKIKRLQQISDLILEKHLEQLRTTAAARNTSLQRLQDLTLHTDPDLIPPHFAKLQARYEGWAEKRRGEVNIMLARQTAEWMEQKDTALGAFGRAQNLRKLYEGD